jgi:glycosyltransferase involved in cell wall biosynthesis
MINILYIGQFTDAAGYANASRSYLRLLDKFLDKNEYNLKIFTVRFEKDNYATEEEREIIKKYELTSSELIHFCENNKYTILLCGLPNYYYLNDKQYPVKQAFDSMNRIKAINCVFWETNKVPVVWEKAYKEAKFDKIIVACNDNRETFENQLGITTNVVRTPVYDISVAEKKSNKEKFSILSMSQWQYRKGFDILVRAFCQEFFNNPEAELVIKSYRAETTAGFDVNAERQAVIQEILSYKRSVTSYGRESSAKIFLKPGFISREEIKKLYEESDVFCLPTRGEGFGLTIAQAALSGMPCIVPELGGHVDFLDKENTFFIESRYEPAINMPYGFYCGVEMNLVEPSLLDTRRQMRKAYNLWKDGKLAEIGKRAQKHTENILSESKIFSSLMQELAL